MSNREITAETIADALNEARSNDYDVSDWTVEDICLDLIAYSTTAARPPSSS